MRVLSMRGRSRVPEPNEVRIDRTTKWGNRYRIGPDGTREEVIAKHREWIRTQPHLMAVLGELRGRDLLCWCSPLACHGDNLVELVREHFPNEG
jgi:hypothetical protein